MVAITAEPKTKGLGLRMDHFVLTAFIKFRGPQALKDKQGNSSLRFLLVEAAPAEPKTSENKTPPTHSTAFLCDSGTLWIHVFRVVSIFAPEARNALLLSLPYP